MQSIKNCLVTAIIITPAEHHTIGKLIPDYDGCQRGLLTLTLLMHCKPQPTRQDKHPPERRLKHDGRTGFKYVAVRYHLWTHLEIYLCAAHSHLWTWLEEKSDEGRKYYNMVFHCNNMDTSHLHTNELSFPTWNLCILNQSYVTELVA